MPLPISQHTSMAHLRHLCLDIGVRPGASPANRAAASYVREVFASAGLAVEEQNYDSPAWDHQATILQVDGQRLDAANVFSPPCDVQVTAVPVCTVAELERADLAGRALLMYGDLTKETLTPKNNLLYSVERDQRIATLLEEKRPVAVITVNPTVGSLTRRIVDWDLGIPSATVTPESGLALLERPDSPIHMRIDACTTAGLSSTIIGRTRGRRPERIVLCAHYDTQVDTQGALDNGSGTATLLTLAQTLASADLETGLDFIAFGDHEWQGRGSVEYVRHCEHEFASILAAINMDYVGNRVGTNTVAAMACSEGFRSLVDAEVVERPGMMWIDPWPQSDHSTFSWRGVPAVAFSSNWDDSIHHTPADTIRWVSPEKLAEVVEAAAGVVRRLQNKSISWAREPQPAS